MRAVEREEEVRILGTRRPYVQLPAAEGEVVVDQVEVLAALHQPGMGLRREDRHERRTRLPHHRDGTVLDDAGLLAGDVLQRRAGELRVVQGDVRDDGDVGPHHVRGVPPSEHAHLDDCHVDGHVGEVAERGGGHDLEVAGADAGDHLRVGHGRDGGCEVLLRHRL